MTSVLRFLPSGRARGSLALSAETRALRLASVLLAVDVGNTQTVLGLFRGDELADSFRLATDRSRTGDELGVTLAALFDLEDVDGICLSTTVPALQREWERVAERWAQAPLLTVGPG